MKKFTYLLAVAAVFTACNSGNNGYTVTGTVEGAADGDTVYLETVEGRQFVKLDSAVIKDGTFTFKGTQDTAVNRYISYKAEGKDGAAIDFFLENGKIKINLSQENNSATGTANNDAYQEIRAQINGLNKQMMSIYESMSDTTLTDEQRVHLTEKRKKMAGKTAVGDSSKTEGQFLRKWEARGSISFKQMRGFSRMFPLPIWMEPTTMRFNTNDITLTDARLHLGKSNFTLNGEISQIRKAMLRGGKLKGNFNLNSDYIDCNQLMQAVNNGMQYGENTDLLMLSDENIAQLNTESLQDSIAQTETDTTSQLFVLPAFLDVALHTNAKRIDFKDLELKNVVGEIVLRDQSINLSKLNIQSNMGNGNLTMVYRAKNGQEATAGLDLDMEDVKVEKLIALFPSIDTLVPMLRSFEGVLDCQVTATCKMDSTMSLIMPSINSSCYLHGDNMVLLDGETFTEISKTLMFKNKKRNMIDSISVDLAIKDNKIEVFPFLVEMDRYKVAVGGTHNLDMTFNYHLSVLKSPVPFKLGIDITGNLDDFKYKITKCKYKDIFKPAKQAELDSTRKNIRKDIRDAVRKQIEEAAPELGKDLALVKAADVWEP